MSHDVIDLFAGPGGWDHGVRGLGLRPLGIEWDTAAVETAQAAGHLRYQADIAQLDPRDFHGARGLIASPPCQGFSMAGKGKGRADALLLLAALGHIHTFRDVENAIGTLHEQMTDDRSLLVLEPLRWALALTPSWLAWEQVPGVLPIWEACAAVLRGIGYTVDTRVLSAEQYGVPQTRRRAILVARAPWFTAQHGRAALPDPTHSRYYARAPKKLDPGVQSWVSMAEALSWGLSDRPQTMLSAGGFNTAGQRERPTSEPSATITGKGTAYWQSPKQRVTVAEAAVLQSFPADYPFRGTKTEQYRQVGDAVPPLLAQRVVSAAAGIGLPVLSERAA